MCDSREMRAKRQVVEGVILNPEIVGLPWVKGYGFMPDLPIAMSMDETLLQMVKDAVEETGLAKLKEKFEKIIFRCVDKLWKYA